MEEHKLTHDPYNLVIAGSEDRATSWHPRLWPTCSYGGA